MHGGCSVLRRYELSAQDLDARRERVLKGLNTTLAWLQECIVLSGVPSKLAIEAVIKLKLQALHAHDNPSETLHV